MIIFFDIRTGNIFGTVDGRTHDEKFVDLILMSSSNIPIDKVGKFVVPTKPIEEKIIVPIKESFADVNDDFKVKEVVVGTKEEIRIRELAFDVPFAGKLYLHEDPIDPLNLINCRVILDKENKVIDIVEK